MRKGWETVVCIASGPSFDDAQAQQLETARAAGLCRLLVVNDNYRRLPNADALYACDEKWWEVHASSVRSFAGEKWTQEQRAAQRWGLYLVHCFTPGRGLCVKPGVIHAGGNSGFQAVNLAYHFGATRILLVGYDMQATGSRAHWFGDHPASLPQNMDDMVFASWRKRFGYLVRDLKARGVAVTNCSTHTGLTCVKRATLEEALCALSPLQP